MLVTHPRFHAVAAGFFRGAGKVLAFAVGAGLALAFLLLHA